MDSAHTETKTTETFISSWILSAIMRVYQECSQETRLFIPYQDAKCQFFGETAARPGRSSSSRERCQQQFRGQALQGLALDHSVTVCTRTCVCLCICVGVFIRVYIIYICIYSIYVYIHVHCRHAMHICLCACFYVIVYIYIYLYICMHVCVYFFIDAVLIGLLTQLLSEGVTLLQLLTGAYTCCEH